LQLVVELLRLLKVLAHPPHRLSEPADRLEHLTRLEITQHLMPVPDGTGIVQRRAEQRFLLVLLAPRGHRLQHLTEVQVGEELRLLGPASAGPVPGCSNRMLSKRAAVASGYAPSPVCASSAEQGEPGPGRSPHSISFHRDARAAYQLARGSRGGQHE
jgi:hypothetical protein